MAKWPAHTLPLWCVWTHFISPLQEPQQLRQEPLTVHPRASGECCYHVPPLRTRQLIFQQLKTLEEAQVIVMRKMLSWTASGHAPADEAGSPFNSCRT